MPAHFPLLWHLTVLAKVRALLAKMPNDSTDSVRKVRNKSGGVFGCMYRSSGKRAPSELGKKNKTLKHEKRQWYTLVEKCYLVLAKDLLLLFKEILPYFRAKYYCLEQRLVRKSISIVRQIESN